MLSVGKNQGRILRFVPAGSLLNVRRDGKDDHAEHDVIGSNTMKNRAKVPGDVMGPRTHRQEFCFVP